MPTPDDYPQPEWNDATSVSAAVNAVAAASNETESWAAYHQLLYAVGNNHAGTYYPVALAIVPYLQRLLQEGAPWSQHAAINVLIELCGSFQPEPGHDLYQGSRLTSSLLHAVTELASAVETLANGGGVPAASARDLLELLHERSAKPSKGL